MALQKIDISQGNNLILIYGDNGVGKTHLAATAPCKKLFIDYYGNPSTLLKFPKDSYDVVQGPEKWNDIQKMMADPLLDEYPLIVLDNLTGLYRILTTDATKIPMKGNDGYRISSEIPILRDYNVSSERLRYVVGQLRDRVSKQHIIAICHTKTTKDEDTGKIFGGPSLPGQVPAHVLSLFGEILYLSAQGDKVKCHVSNTGYFPACTRKLATRTTVENPNLDTMYNW